MNEGEHRRINHIRRDDSTSIPPLRGTPIIPAQTRTHPLDKIFDLINHGPKKHVSMDFAGTIHVQESACFSKQRSCFAYSDA